jgi:hypothetical protein
MKIFRIKNSSNAIASGRCYDQNFMRFLPTFGEKKIAVFLKNQCYDNFFIILLCFELKTPIL